MNSTKRYLPILATGLLLLFSSKLIAQNSQTSFGSTFNVPAMCPNQQPMVITGPTTIDYHVNSTADLPHVTLHLLIKADGQDQANNAYHAELEANGQFGDVAPSYDVPFHSVWIGQGGAPNFSITGLITVVMGDNGAVSYTTTSKVDPPTCTN